MSEAFLLSQIPELGHFTGDSQRPVVCPHKKTLLSPVATLIVVSGKKAYWYRVSLSWGEAPFFLSFSSTLDAHLLHKAVQLSTHPLFSYYINQL